MTTGQLTGARHGCELRLRSVSRWIYWGLLQSMAGRITVNWMQRIRMDNGNMLPIISVFFLRACMLCGYRELLHKRSGAFEVIPWSRDTL